MRYITDIQGVEQLDGSDLFLARRRYQAVILPENNPYNYRNEKSNNNVGHIGGSNGNGVSGTGKKRLAHPTSDGGCCSG